MNKTAKVTHTPGPWSGLRNIVGEDTTVVCSVNRPAGGDPNVADANARVLAAAPELLDACNLLRAAVDTLLGELAGRKAADWATINNALVDSGRAILKAEGGSK